jgi:hypothetical protein
MLEAMGRPTVLVDATGAQAPSPQVRWPREGGRGLVPVERVSRPTALLQQMAEETETEEESLVLTDTAPLAVSAETEYLARFVDCAIVVIESGVTTRRNCARRLGHAAAAESGRGGICVESRGTGTMFERPIRPSGLRFEAIGEASAGAEQPQPQPELEEVQPAIETPADVPWWLSDVRRGHSEPTRPPLLWQPARVWSSRKPDAASEHWVTESNAKPEPAQNASTGKSWPADKPSWETASNGRETPSSSGAPQDMQRSELDEVPTNLTSRLSGLRNLLFVLGVKGPHGSLSGSEDSAEGQAGPVSSSHVSSTGLRTER